ncbi:hypothetical protein PV396_43430 [Streptomyces sp. ME02-8801-2C]|uniref:hypothetical protein n=1 Tax=Streptomyces sp. ME02-8801-2C TaxID=3028680 RepID=UPI0029BE426F|nr:hypothetical protein [Streptomyces sp. ME02-8801-2C]MDX3458703.1 hypothetical protein [Streptomyces sp. ME02-8801-2C]
MQNSVITASGALLAALIGLSGALWVTISNQRKQQQAQRANWTYDRRKDAYLAFIDAARAFTPLTEELFLAEERDYIARQANGSDLENETREEVTTWADTLWSPFLADYSTDWPQRAPARLHTLTMAFDRIDLEGPPDVTAAALKIIESAHALIAGPALFAKEAEQEAAAGGSATETDFRRTEVHQYRMLCGKFREEVHGVLNP